MENPLTDFKITSFALYNRNAWTGSRRNEYDWFFDGAGLKNIFCILSWKKMLRFTFSLYKKTGKGLPGMA